MLDLFLNRGEGRADVGVLLGTALKLNAQNLDRTLLLVLMIRRPQTVAFRVASLDDVVPRNHIQDTTGLGVTVIRVPDNACAATNAEAGYLAPGSFNTV